MTEAHFRTNKISSRVAPASSAARIWRRVPSGLRLVQAALSPKLINSTNFRGSGLAVHGFVDIFTHASAHFGSQSRSLLIEASQGPVGSIASAPINQSSILS